MRAELTTTLLASGLLLAVGCSEPNAYQPPPPPEVTVAAPVAKPIVETEEFVGYCDASKRIDVRARVKGFLESYAFKEGDNVAAGAPLLRIDPKPFQAALEQEKATLALAQAEVSSAEANVTQTQARAANADAQYRRGEKTLQGGGITEAELDDLRTDRAAAIADFRAAEASVASARAQVDVAGARVAQAELDLGYTDVRAPMAGRVGRQQVDVGNLVGASDPTLLTEIIQYDPVYVYFNVTEREFLEHVRNRPEADGAEGLTLAEQKQEVRVGLEGEADFPHVGYLDFAALEIDSGTGTYQLRAKLKNADRLIPSGAQARVQVSGDAIDALLVPDAAIGRSPSGSFVIVVGAGDKCERRTVTLGPLVEEGRAILDGLTAEDRVVTNGLQQARPGVVVRPISAADSLAGVDAPAGADALATGDAPAGGDDPAGGEQPASDQ